MRPRGLQNGFSLAEVLVAIAIGLFLTAGIVQVFVANKQTYRFNEALARMQENGRYALELIASDLRMAGFWGCSRGEWNSRVNSNDDDYNALWHEFADGLEGRDSPGGNPGDPDEITIRGAVGTGLVVQGHGPATNPVTVSGGRTAVEEAICEDAGCLSNKVADMVLVSNCKRGDIFQAICLSGPVGGPTAVRFNPDPASGCVVPTDTPGNDGTGLADVYDATATLHPLRVATYCVRDPDSLSCDDPGAPGKRSLYLRKNGVNRGPVVEGVENMQIAYGEDTNGDGTANRYVPAPAAPPPAGWFDNVVSVRMSVLLASTDDGLTTDTPQTFDLNGETATCPSGHICQLASSTITLRNRVQ